jgi:ABC-type transporter Mla subunit MlaD
VITTYITNAISHIQDFKDNKVPDMVNQLQSIAQRSMVDAKTSPNPADASSLLILSNNYASLASQANQIQANFQAILTGWQTLAGDVNAAIAETKTAFSDTTANNFQAVVNDLNQVFTEWNAAYSQAGSLSIQVNVNTTQL